jgi:hypothetical protein
MTTLTPGHDALQTMCGPKFNAFVPSHQPGDEPCRFFRINTRPVVWRRPALDAPTESPAASSIHEEDVERWDGMA